MTRGFGKQEDHFSRVDVIFAKASCVFATMVLLLIAGFSVGKAILELRQSLETISNAHFLILEMRIADAGRPGNDCRRHLPASFNSTCLPNFLRRIEKAGNKRGFDFLSFNFLDYPWLRGGICHWLPFLWH